MAKLGFAMNRFASRYNHRDANEPAIVKALAEIGIEWYEGGPLDGWIKLGNQHVAVEIKTEKGKLTKGQADFIAHCQRNELPFRVWRTPLQAIESVQEWRWRRSGEFISMSENAP